MCLGLGRPGQVHNCCWDTHDKETHAMAIQYRCVHQGNIEREMIICWLSKGIASGTTTVECQPYNVCNSGCA